jgi:hypothetical protein
MSVDAQKRMRALSVHEPYATRIIAGQKPIEYRTWFTKYRGLLAIHASKPTGAILGTVELVDVRGRIGRQGFEWHLRNPNPFRKAIRCRGRQGLFWVNL